MDQPPSDAGSTRRDMLARLALGGAAAAACAGLSGCALFMSSVEPDITLIVDGGTLIVPRSILFWERGLGNAMVVGLAGRQDKLMLLKTPEGEIVALSTTCTHRGCDVRWSNDAGHIVCPCHGSEYDLHGGNLKGPATKPLKAFKVTVRPEALSIAVG